MPGSHCKRRFELDLNKDFFTIDDRFQEKVKAKVFCIFMYTNNPPEMTTYVLRSAHHAHPNKKVIK